MKGSTTRYRIRERYWTVDEIATEAGMTHAGVWSRIRAGVTGEALLQRIPDKAKTRAERAIRRSSRRWPGPNTSAPVPTADIASTCSSLRTCCGRSNQADIQSPPPVPGSSLSQAEMVWRCWLSGDIA